MFNIKDDPYELHNVFDDNSALGIEMAEAIKALGLFRQEMGLLSGSIQANSEINFSKGRQTKHWKHCRWSKQ